MKICFPARNKNNEHYATLDDMMGCLARETHGSWLAGTNRMWHGGIHLTETSAPGAMLRARAMDSAYPLQCMADGEVVAWRVNRDYLGNTYNGQALRYSTTFVLVRSLCRPDPRNDRTWLEFYSLYMGLAPLSAFVKRKCMRVIASRGVRKRQAGKNDTYRTQTGVGPVPPAQGILAKDCRVLILEESRFTNHGENQPFGLARELDKEGRVVGKAFWVTTLPENMIAEGEHYTHLPAWMQYAVAQGKFDAVVQPATRLAIQAGDAIGFLGEEIVPAGNGKTSPGAY
ncbi:hypothetical protein [Martelella alba]|uniref:Uncharacterized protein n=1 Tax=Martelella alba TaxID=2590451 RepID=A0ABY2SFZ8_9HYPH|nr:hypothetical protein [Martelella alba]TKI03970.1 hypothetical protein FCN80_19850 [Martelella alba]